MCPWLWFSCLDLDVEKRNTCHNVKIYTNTKTTEDTTGEKREQRRERGGTKKKKNRKNSVQRNSLLK